MFADCISAVAGDIVITGYSQESERQALEASTASFGGEILCDAQSHEASMPCAQRTQAFAHSIDGDADAYIPDAIIVPGSSHFDFRIVMHAKSLSFGFRSIHLQAACPAESLVVSCPYPIYNLL